MSAIGSALQKIPKDVVRLCRRLRGAGHEAHLVGGGVRDLLMDRPVHDWDVATSARPEQVQALFRKTVPIGIAHGTVAVVLPERQVEVTTYRGEGAYSDGRHPDSVTFVGSLEEDLRRRDLTINAMAIDPVGGELFDPEGGSEDLGRRLVRAVGEPTERFGEDGLRTMRAVRFAAVLEFTLEARTLDAISGAIAGFRKVSHERIRDELLKLLAARRPSVGLELMRITGLMAEVLPELLEGLGVSQNRYHREDLYAHALRTCDATAGDPILRLAGLLHDVGKSRVAQPHPQREGEMTFYGHAGEGVEICAEIARRLRLSGRERRRICHLVQHHDFPLEGWTDSGLRRLLRRVGLDQVDDLLALRAADLEGRDSDLDQTGLLVELGERLRRLIKAKAPLRQADLAVDGEQIMERLGIPPGPRVGQLLRALMEKVLEEPALNTEERLLEAVVELERDLPR